MNVTRKDLPTGEEILDQLQSIKTSDLAGLTTTSQWAFKSTRDLVNCLHKYVGSNDFRSDPEVYQDDLLHFHFLNCGLIGVATSMYDRAIKLYGDDYFANAKASGGKGTQSGSKEYAESEASDLKGLKATLEQLQWNLRERLTLCKTSKF